MFRYSTMIIMSQSARVAADAGAKVIVMDDGHQNPSVAKALSLVVIDGETRGGEWPFGDGRVFPAGPMREPPQGPQVAFAGVGKPWKVERALRAAGCDLADFWPFPDHHAYAEADLKRLAERADQFGAGLVTTEKDWARLPVAWRARIKPWPVRAVFEDEASLDALLSSHLPREAAGGGPRAEAGSAG